MSKFVLIVAAFSLTALGLGSSDAASVTFEAEAGALGSDWAVSSSTSPAYVTIQSNANTNNPGSANRVATYTVTFPSAATYELFARVRVGPNGANDDSLFYGNGFGMKSPTTDNDWRTVNGLASGGFTGATDAVTGNGSAGTQVWKWVNLSQFNPSGSGTETPITFAVPAGNLTQTFQIGAREDGLDLDKFVFGTAGDTFTVSDLDNGTPPSPPVCEVTWGNTQQHIDGFGFSDGWSGTLSAAKNKALYETLGMTIFRAFVHMNPATDYNTPIANINAARAAGAKVFATGWADKSWTNSAGHLLPSRYEDYAIWLRDQAAAKNVDYISPFNEPDGNVATQVRWTPTQILNFIKTNAPTIGKPIIMPEAINFNDAYSDPVLNDPVARSNITIVAGHFYGNGNRVHTNAIARGFPVWQTEYYITDSATDMRAAMVSAKVISDAMNHQFSAYCWWWVRDAVTDGSNLVLNDGTIFKNGYVMGQFARWVRPGMVRCSATYNPTHGIFVTAYRGDTNGLVIVALNTNLAPTSLTFATQNATNLSVFGVYRTSETEGMANVPAATVTNNTFSYTLPGQSVTTFAQFFGSIPTESPASLSATVVPSGQIRLSWSAVTNISRYNVKRSATNGGPYTTVAYGVAGTNFTDMVYYSGATYYYVVSAVNEGGEGPDSSQASATTAARVSIEPVADAYVNDGSSTNSNFGTLTNLVTKNDGVTNTGLNRITYLRFDIRALTNAQSAKLILTPAKVDGNIALSYEQVTNNNWSETDITWNNQPGGSGVIFTNRSGYVVNVPVTIDLTAVVTNLAANDSYLSLRVIDTNALNTRIDFYSKEWPDSNYRPVLQVTNSLIPANTAPVLGAITNRTIGVGVTMNITNIATDSDLPAQTLTFSLLTAPSNATINSGSGVLTWRPLTTQTNTTNPFTVMVADNGTPSLSATQSFVVSVPPLTQPQLSMVVLDGDQLVLQVNGASGPDYQIQASTNLLNWSAVFTTNSPLLPFGWTNHTSGGPMNFFRVRVGPPF